MSGAIIDMVSQHWNTPEYILERVRAVFGNRGAYDGQVDLDPCSNEHSTVGARVSFALPIDGLAQSWEGYESMFINPPYGRDRERGTSIEDWVKKASESNTPCIMLIPASTETTFWFDYIWPTYDAICFLRGRVKFLLNGEPKAASTKGSALIYWGPDKQRFKDFFEDIGHVIVA